MLTWLSVMSEQLVQTKPSAGNKDQSQTKCNFSKNVFKSMGEEPKAGQNWIGVELCKTAGEGKICDCSSLLPEGPLQFACIWQKATDLSGFSHQRRTWWLEEQSEI